MSWVPTGVVDSQNTSQCLRKLRSDFAVFSGEFTAEGFGEPSQAGPRAIMQELERSIAPEAEVGMLEFKEQFLLFADRPLVHFSYLAPLPQQEWNAWRWIRAGQARVLLLPDHLALRCFDLAKKRVLGEAHRRNWVLLDASAARESCNAATNRTPYRYVPVKKDILS